MAQRQADQAMSTAYKQRLTAIKQAQKRVGTKRLSPQEMPNRPPLGWVKFACRNCGEMVLQGHFIPPSFGDPGMWICGGVLTEVAP